MTPIARFVTRPTGDGRSDILLGSFTTSNQTPFEPNTIYEIYDLMGTTMIRKIGKSLVVEGDTPITDSPIACSWNMQYQDVGVRGGKYLLISQEEYKMLTEGKTT